MKCFAIPFLLLAIAVFQAIRVEPASADVIPEATALKDRAAIVRRWQAGPYRIEPPDVLSVEVKWNNFDGVINAEHEDVLSIVTATGLKVARQEDGAIRLTARQLVLRLESLVRPDGQISIGGLVRVYVTGMTTEEAKEEIAIELSKRFGTPEVKVDVSQANSRVVYVVLQRGQSGDYVARLNHPGHLTALDALTEALANADCDVKEVDQMYVEASPSEQLARIDLDPIVCSL